jgi:hypothetical protein
MPSNQLAITAQLVVQISYTEGVLQKKHGIFSIINTAKRASVQ